MNIHHRGSKLAAILLLAAMALSACQQSVSNAPLATPTLITPTGLFVTPLTGSNPMDMIEEFAQGTAAALTAAAGGGTPTTPQVVATTGVDLTAISTYSTGTLAAPTSMVATATTPLVASTVISSTVITTPVAVGTIPTAGPKPGTYTLEKGEWPYCIARRFNVNPIELLNLSGLTSEQSNALMPGQKLVIPQSGSAFPGDTEWHAHPATYTVSSADTTVFAVACYYGDVDPNVIAAYNNISVASKLAVGTKLNIP